LARKHCTALGPGSEGNELGCFSSTLIFLRARSACASRAIGALLSSYSSLDGSDGLRRSFPTKIEKAVSHRDVDSFSAPNEMGDLSPYLDFLALHLSESRPGPARVVSTTGGEHLSIRSRAVTGSPITPKANFNSPNQGSSRVVIVDSYKDIE
jgi:hypothetical protein